MNIIYWLLIVLIATTIHELGHYWAARLQGVGVKSFSVGMGPILARRMWRGTEWRLSALPIGGYVEIDGMVPDYSPEGKPQPLSHGYSRLRTPGKVAIMLAGPAMNLLLALALLTGTYATQGVTDVRPDRARIGEVLPGSRAQAIGLRAGDVIVAVDGTPLPRSYEVDNRPREGYLRVADTLARNGPHRLSVERASQRLEIPFAWTARVNGVQQRLGISYGPDFNVRQVGLAGAGAEAGRTIVGAVPQVISAFGGLVSRLATFDVRGDGSVVGPVGTVQVVGRAAQQGIWGLIGIAALLNVSLAFFNLLPIPGLDGGRVLLALVGAARRRPLDPAQEGVINFAGFAFVMLLMVFVVLGDVVRLF